MSGLVSIVGAGPGDPELLTRRAAKRLRQADVVYHDALVPDAILALARHAVRYGVGKRAGKPSASQETIERLLVRSARRGKRVVRLKGGDPFLFGRGGEEALALARAGVPFEVVPGLSSALAAPALAGIPVTHRGVSSALLVVSGHAEEAWAPLLRATPPNAATLVVLMGLGARAAIASLLLSRGWSPATPAAILLAAGTPCARTMVRPLAALGAPLDAGDAPGTLVVGEVVAIPALVASLGEERKAHVRG